MITLNGYTLTQWQRCKRIHVMGKTHTFLKWRPESLLGAVLRMAIVGLSNGGSLEDISNKACVDFLAEARSPGIDVAGIDTYTLAMDYCAIIRNVLEYLSRLTLLTLHHIKPLQLSPSVLWQFLSLVDESGVLHKWQFVDYINEDLLPDLHSWEVFGDIAAYESPMVLHLISIGQRRGCHQHTPWARIYAHPKLANVHRFQKKSTLKLEGEWRPTWFSANSGNTSKQWVDLMIRDNVVGGIIQHINVKEVSKEHVQEFKADVLTEAISMDSYDGVEPKSIPMSRYACDHPYTCPHQLYCYTTKTTLDTIGVYKKREIKKETVCQ